MDWTLARTCVRMIMCSNDGDWLRSPRPLAAGVGRAGRGEALRPADGSPRSQCRPGARAGPAGLTADFGASPEGVMTMISTLTAAGTPARNALPSDTGPLSAGP